MDSLATNFSNVRPALAPRPKSTSSIFRLREFAKTDHAKAVNSMNSNTPTPPMTPNPSHHTSTAHRKSPSGSASFSTLGQTNTSSSSTSIRSNTTPPQPADARLPMRRQKSNSFRQTLWKAFTRGDDDRSLPQLPAQIPLVRLTLRSYKQC